MRKWISCLAFASAIGGQALAEQVSPWLGNEAEFEAKISYHYRTYDKMDVKNTGAQKRASDDHVLAGKIGLTVMGAWEMELDGALIDGDQRDSGLEYLRMSAKRLLMNDLVGDPFSVSFGMNAKLAPASTHADPGSVHHSYLDLEAMLSVGKEIADNWNWDYRYWAMGAIGVGNKGNPWLRGGLYLEKNFSENHIIQLFVKARQGLGGKDLSSASLFSTYRNLSYHYVDMGLDYSFPLDVWGRVFANYSYRVSAKYTPVDVHEFAVGLNLPFSL